MSRVRQWLANLWHAFRIRRKYGAAICPDAIAAQARELAVWAEEAGRGGLLAEGELRRLVRLASELRRVARVAESKAFRRQPPQRRLALHARLTTARTGLLAILGRARLMTEKPQ